MGDYENSLFQSGAPMIKADFYLAADRFLNDLFKELTVNKIDLEAHWDIDHLCYRAATIESYNNLKEQFKSFGNLLIASDVNGREISTYELFTPIQFKEWRIDVIELPAPKKGKVTKEGFEHLEVVVDASFEDLIEKYKRLNLDTNGLKKGFNKELEICLGDNNLKFHQLSLLSVINVEKNTKVWSAITQSKILDIFSEYKPLIAGTFPLNVEVEGSDVDILMQAKDLEEVRALVLKHFGNCTNFSQSIQKVDELDTLICSFIFNEVPFELFIQDKEPVRQTAYLHFLIEERLLKLGGELFKEKIINERKAGLKTEPAFAKIIGIEGDAYLQLLELQKKSSEDLIMY